MLKGCDGCIQKMNLEDGVLNENSVMSLWLLLYGWSYSGIEAMLNNQSPTVENFTVKFVHMKVCDRCTQNP